jgi:molecular chaperone DnaJ
MDLYLILGVPPSATTADIKRAYRRLARRYHPGINPGDRTAEAKFAEISSAYETLVDPSRRQQYDQSGAAVASAAQEAVRSFEFTEFDFSVAATGAQAATFSELFAEVLHPIPGHGPARPEPGADLHAELTVSFVDAMRGVERQVIVTRQVPCAGCGGAGQIVKPAGRCASCQGTGRTRWARGHLVFSKACAACGGTGQLRFLRCATCAGHGRTARSEAVPVGVSPGTFDGVRLRIPEKGHAGRHGGRPGDLYVAVHVESHPVFRREGDMLLCRVPVAVHEAALGARIDVPSLEGPIKLRVPPGTQGGHQFRVSGRGVPGPGGVRGDLLVEVALVLPPALDERSRELMREFGQRNAADVRRDLWQGVEAPQQV